MCDKSRIIRWHGSAVCCPSLLLHLYPAHSACSLTSRQSPSMIQTLSGSPSRSTVTKHSDLSVHGALCHGRWFHRLCKMLPWVNLTGSKAIVGMKAGKGHLIAGINSQRLLSGDTLLVHLTPQLVLWPSRLHPVSPGELKHGSPLWWLPTKYAEKIGFSHWCHVGKVWAFGGGLHSPKFPLPDIPREDLLELTGSCLPPQRNREFLSGNILLRMSCNKVSTGSIRAACILVSPSPPHPCFHSPEANLSTYGSEWGSTKALQAKSLCSLYQF